VANIKVRMPRYLSSSHGFGTITSHDITRTCCQIRCSSVNESRYRLHTRITQQSVDRYNGFHGESQFTHSHI